MKRITVLFFTGPGTWWFFSPEQCDDLLFPIQSPIALNSTMAESINLTPLQLSNFESAPDSITLGNDGAALILMPKFQTGKTPAISDGTLIPGRTYTLDHVLWHWGEKDEYGGEHVIDGER